jgi:hypothetical protein
MGSLILRSVGKYHLHTFPRIFHCSAIGKQHALESGSNASLGQKSSGLLLDFNHRGQVIQFGRPAEIIQRIEIKRGVFGEKFNIIEHTGMTESFND